MMNIIVPVRFVPDLVEELEIDETGAALDETFLDLILNEFDDHAIEQAILLKERQGANVTVITPDVEVAGDVLAIAAAKGADRLVKLMGAGPAAARSHGLALLLANAINQMAADLILTGVQAHDDLDGQLGPLLAEHLGMPYLGYIAGVRVADGTVMALKEYPGGLLAEMEVTLPAVLGIQAADAPPRYVAFSRIQQAKKTVHVEAVSAEAPMAMPPLTIQRMFRPESGQRAIMLEGEPEEVAGRVLMILAEQGI